MMLANYIKVMQNIAIIVITASKFNTFCRYGIV